MKNLTTLTNGDRLKLFRKLNGMDQEQLANAAGFTSASDVGRLETGARKMTPGKAITLAKVLDCRVEDLMVELYEWELDAKKISKLPIFQKYKLGEISRITDVPLAHLSKLVLDGNNLKVDRKTVERLALALCGGKVEMLIA